MQQLGQLGPPWWFCAWFVLHIALLLQYCTQQLTITGQICVDLSSIFPIIATGRSADDMHCNAESWQNLFR